MLIMGNVAAAVLGFIKDQRLIDKDIAHFLTDITATTTATTAMLRKNKFQRNLLNSFAG